MQIHRSPKTESIVKRTMTIMYIMAIVLLFVILMLNTASAQTTVAIGGKVGYSGSQFSGDDVGSLDIRNTVAGGLFVNIAPISFLSFQPELLFRQKGAVNNRSALNIREEYKLNYFEVPLLLKLRIPIAKVFYPNIFGGPYYAFNTSASYRAVQTDSGVAMDRDVNVKRSDYGGIVGAGLDVELKFLMLSLDVRYGMGGTKIDDSDDALDLKNRDLTVMAGVGFLFGK